jgi:hypothetical protein
MDTIPFMGTFMLSCHCPLIPTVGIASGSFQERRKSSRGWYCCSYYKPAVMRLELFIWTVLHRMLLMPPSDRLCVCLLLSSCSIPLLWQPWGASRHRHLQLQRLVGESLHHTRSHSMLRLLRLPCLGCGLLVHFGQKPGSIVVVVRLLKLLRSMPSCTFHLLIRSFVQVWCSG